MGKEIDLSVLIPAYNNTESLIRALNSIKEQTIAKKVHVSISDDCSPKKINQEKILKFRKYFKSLKFFRQSNNLGVLSNVTWLFNTVETDLYTILQHDDYIYNKNFYESALNSFYENKDLVIFYGNAVQHAYFEDKKTYKEIIEKNKKMYDLSNIKLKGLEKNNIMNGESFTYNLANNSEYFMTAWSAIILSTKATRKVGGYGGNYSLTKAEANSLKVYREEEHFGILYLLSILGNIKFENNPSVIRFVESSSFSVSSTNPGREMIRDPHIYALYKAAYFAEELLGSEKASPILKNISIKISKLSLFKGTMYSRIFFNSYKIKNNKLSDLFKVSLKKAGNFKSQITTIKIFYYFLLKEKIKALLKFFKIKY
tara:strand:+ start:166 stop:1278 length:1113 start_codon:yes stop_codon:yes gene_type:complete